MNYPEDIRQYDNDPKSPFYVDSKGSWVNQRKAEIAEQMLSESYQLNNAVYNISDVLEFISADEDLTSAYEQKLSDTISYLGVQQLSKAEALTKWMQEQAEKVAEPFAELELAQGDDIPAFLRRQAS